MSVTLYIGRLHQSMKHLIIYLHWTPCCWCCGQIM